MMPVGLTIVASRPLLDHLADLDLPRRLRAVVHRTVRGDRPWAELVEARMCERQIERMDRRAVHEPGHPGIECRACCDGRARHVHVPRRRIDAGQRDPRREVEHHVGSVEGSAQRDVITNVTDRVLDAMGLDPRERVQVEGAHRPTARPECLHEVHADEARQRRSPLRCGRQGSPRRSSDSMVRIVGPRTVRAGGPGSPMCPSPLRRRRRRRQAGADPPAQVPTRTHRPDL